MSSLPKARGSGLVVEELPDELLIYDLERNRAHCLNQTSRFIWQHCDGKTTIPNIARMLEKRVGTHVDEDVVWLAIAQLRRRHLLEEQITLPAAASLLSRRELVRKLGLAAAVSVPLVTSIVAPRAVKAQTCLPAGQPCSVTTPPCCPPLLCFGTCQIGEG